MSHVLDFHKVPFGYCWSEALVPKPPDWGPHIDVVGFFSLAEGKLTSYQPPPELAEFLADGASRAHHHPVVWTRTSATQLLCGTMDGTTKHDAVVNTASSHVPRAVTLCTQRLSGCLPTLQGICWNALVSQRS